MNNTKLKEKVRKIAGSLLEEKGVCKSSGYLNGITVSKHKAI